MTLFDQREIASTVADVLEVFPAILALPQFARWEDLRLFPLGSCGITSIAVGLALLDRDQGDWNLRLCYQGQFAMWLPSHAWLTLTDDGRAVATVDATIHQFKGHAAPFVGLGNSPVAGRFPWMRNDNPISEVRELLVAGEQINANVFYREVLRALNGRQV